MVSVAASSLADCEGLGQYSGCVLRGRLLGSGCLFYLFIDRIHVVLRHIFTKISKGVVVLASAALFLPHRGELERCGDQRPFFMHVTTAEVFTHSTTARTNDVLRSWKQDPPLTLVRTA